MLSINVFLMLFSYSAFSNTANKSLEEFSQIISSISQNSSKEEYGKELYKQALYYEQNERLSIFMRLLYESGHQNYAPALHHLARIYEQGMYGIKQNLRKAVELYNKVIRMKEVVDKREFAYALTALARLYERGGKGVKRNFDRSIRLYHEAGELGHAPALTALAYLYKYGKGVEKNMDESIRLYRQASEKGYAPALHTLAYFYARGIHLEENLNEAINLYRQASQRSYAPSLIALADLYLSGKGVERNIKTALEFYTKASQLGYVLATLKLARLYEGKKEVSRNLNTAVDLYNQIISNNESTSRKQLVIALNALGHIYRIGGDGIEQDINRAVKLFHKAGQLGYVPALTSLAYLYKKGGDGIEQDVHKAMELFREASELGYTPSRLDLAYIYANGEEEIPIDYLEAKKWIDLVTSETVSSLSPVRLEFANKLKKMIYEHLYLNKESTPFSPLRRQLQVVKQLCGNVFKG